MTLPSLPTDLLVLCVEPSNGRPLRACRACSAAFDELAREKGVDLVLRGWRKTSRVVASVVPLESLVLVYLSFTTGRAFLTCAASIVVTSFST